MSNFATALKDEIRRLARKEIRAQVTVTKRAAALHRREIARLKRQLKMQDKKLSQLARNGEGSVATATAVAGDDALDGVRFSSRSVWAQRRRLKLSAAEYGQLVGVSGQTIYHWEQGKSRPRRSQMQGLVRVRGIGRREAVATLNAPQRRKPR